MAYILEFDVFLAAVLQHVPTISFEKLIEVESQLHLQITGLGICTSRDDVYAAMIRYPKIFRKDDLNKQFKRANNSEQYYSSDYIHNEFLNNVPKEILSAIKTVLST